MSSHVEPRRHLEMDGAINVRDLGGYPTSDGRTVRWKTLLRADNVGGLPAESQAALVEYGVRTVIDLQRESELEGSPHVFAASPLVTYYHQPMVGDETPEGMAASSEMASAWLQRMDELEGPARKTATYCMRLDTRRPQIGKTLSILATPGTLPALFHCAAGKDRAGIMAALVLGIAGVPNDTIAEDYALSSYYRWRASLAERDVHEPYEGAPPESFDAEAYGPYRDDTTPEVMLGVIRYLEQRYGGIEGYVLDAGVTQEEIAALRGAVVE